MLSRTNWIDMGSLGAIIMPVSPAIVVGDLRNPRYCLIFRREQRRVAGQEPVPLRSHELDH